MGMAHVCPLVCPQKISLFHRAGFAVSLPSIPIYIKYIIYYIYIESPICPPQRHSAHLATLFGLFEVFWNTSMDSMDSAPSLIYQRILGFMVCPHPVHTNEKPRFTCHFSTSSHFPSTSEHPRKSSACLLSGTESPHT